MHYFLRQFLTECWYCIFMKSNKHYSCAILFIVCLDSEPAAQSDGKACNDHSWQHVRKKSQKQTKDFQNLESGTRWRVTQWKLLSNSPQQRFPVSYSRGLVISCTVISYFIFTLTATWLQQTPEPDAKPITPWGALGRLVTSVDAAHVWVGRSQ